MQLAKLLGIKVTVPLESSILYPPPLYGFCEVDPVWIPRRSKAMCMPYLRGHGLTRLRDKVFRIGHLGDFNELMLLGTLSGIEMGLEIAGVPHKKGGVAAAMDYLVHTEVGARERAVA